MYIFFSFVRAYLLLRIHATTKKNSGIAKHCLISQGVVLLGINAVHTTVQGHPRLEGPIKEVLCFEATLFVDLEIR